MAHLTFLTLFLGLISGAQTVVWSTAGTGARLTAVWGVVEDVSTEADLAQATTKLNAALAAQRIAWVATDPLTALGLDVKEACGLRMVARRQPAATMAH